MGSPLEWERMGREGRGNVVRTPGQGIRFAVGRPLAVQDGVVVGSEGSRPPACLLDVVWAVEKYSRFLWSV